MTDVKAGGLGPNPERKGVRASRGKRGFQNPARQKLGMASDVVRHQTTTLGHNHGYKRPESETELTTWNGAIIGAGTHQINVAVWISEVKMLLADSSTGHTWYSGGW